VVLRRIDGSAVSETTFSSTEELTVVAPVIKGVYFIQVVKGEEIVAVKIIIK
jgi:hypothetical protein